jgi:hypothetical protein
LRTGKNEYNIITNGYEMEFYGANEQHEFHMYYRKYMMHAWTSSHNVAREITN